MDRRAFTVIELLIVIIIIGIMMAVLWRSAFYSMEPTRCQRCIKRLEQIGVALLQYHQEHGTFPPAYSVDEEENPLHSWRVLIAPYLPVDEKDKPVGEIQFDEPWDSENNTAFHQKMPRVFWGVGSGGQSTYKMIVGEKTAAGTSMASWKRKPSEVILLIEAWPPVLWMSPNDFSYDDFDTAIYPNELKNRDPENGIVSFEDRNPDKKPVIGCYHPTEHHVLFADGIVKTYKNWKKPSVRELQMMCQIE